MSTDTFEFDAEPRNDAGKGASRRLRRAGLVPGVIYGGHADPEMISVAHHELIQHLEQESFYSHILDVNVGGNRQQVVLKDLQRHPSKPFILHLDLQRVSADEKIKVQVPLHFINENKAIGVKRGGVVSHHMADVEISCLPKHLPEFIEIDVTALDQGDSIHLSEILLPEGVELTALAAEDAEDKIVVSVHAGHGGAMEDEEEGGEEPGEGPVED
jgi:large subunit ribosomal protein L25